MRQVALGLATALVMVGSLLAGCTPSGEREPVDRAVTAAKKKPKRTPIKGGADTVRVATWNLLLDELAEGSPKRRSSWAAAVVKRKRLGVLGAQEVTGAQRDRLLARLSGWRATDTVSRVVFWDGSRYRRLDEGRFRVSKTVGSDRATWVKLQSRSTGRKFVVMSVHAEPKKKEQMHPVNVRQILEARARVADHVPTIVTGDMNSDYHAARETLVRGLTKGGLKLTYAETDTHFNANCRTYNGNGKSQLCRKKPPVRHIDHVYVSESIDVRYWCNVGSDDATRASDHNPVFAGITMDNRWNR